MNSDFDYPKNDQNWEKEAFGSCPGRINYILVKINEAFILESSNIEMSGNMNKKALLKSWQNGLNLEFVELHVSSDDGL